MLNEYAIRIGESGVALTEELLAVIIEREPGETHTDRVLHSLTVYALTLVTEHGRGAIAEFAGGRSRSGAALNRCLYEVVVNLIGWYRDDARAVKEWAMLPIIAHYEEVRKTGDAATVPAGVKSDYEAYADAHPELLKEDRTTFRAIAEDVFKVALGHEDGRFRREFAVHYDVPSYFIHTRVIGVEDLYDVSSPEGWSIRDRSLMAEPNARVLGMVQLLLLAARFVALRYGLPLEPAARVDAAWDDARDEHNREMAG